MTTLERRTRLYINGNLQFSSRDEARYHEALVLPAMQMVPNAERVLILGGGDGLAAREVLKYPQVKNVTLVDLDPDMTATFRTSATLSALNQGSLSHPKMHVVNDDAAKWLEGSSEKFDVIIHRPTRPVPISRLVNFTPSPCTASLPAILSRKVRLLCNRLRLISHPMPTGRSLPPSKRPN